MYLCVSGINFVSFYYLFLFDFGYNLKKYGKKRVLGKKNTKKVRETKVRGKKK
jgi:hypothetical protein